MSGYLFLVPISLSLGLIGLGAFLWTLRHEQYDDLDGAAERVLFADDRPIVEPTTGPDGQEDDARRADVPVTGGHSDDSPP